jgi:transposase
MSEKNHRRKYTKEFKLEAIQLTESRGSNASEVARNLGIKPNMLSRWIREYKSDKKCSFPGLGKLKEPDEEIRQLRRKLADAEEERDILKKALAIFSKENHRSTSS